MSAPCSSDTAGVPLYLVEATSGHALRKLLGRCPWDHGGSRFGVRGLARLDYLPLWGLVGLVFEPLQAALAALPHVPSA